MNRVPSLFLFGLLGLLVIAAPAQGQRTPYIGYVYPAGGQQGTTVEIRLGGQYIDGTSGAVVSGEGVSAKLTRFLRKLSNQELTLMREQLRVLKRSKKKDATSEKIIARIEERVAEWVNRPANAALAELALVEVTIAPDAKPGRHEIRLISERGMTNPLPFYIGQIPEVARKPMKTSLMQVLGKEQLSQRKRPPEEEEVTVTVPCTMNGQIASGEVNRYRFTATKGQRLVISARARALIPYIADAVPGWFQPVLTLCDADGKEVAYNDDFQFKPDPTIYYEVPADGEYVLTMTDALYRGREDFVYRITLGEVPYLTSIFPLGGRVGETANIEINGWNLDKAKVTPPPKDAAPGVYRVTATAGKIVSNSTPFALDTLPECFDQESNNDLQHAQEVTLPIIVNGRVDQPDDWDVFQFEGKAGETVVAEVTARRLDSPMDSMLKLTDAAGNLLALNDDHEDVGEGLATHHADSYLMVELPADGTYYVHLGETARNGGREYAYRLRISPPRPEFELRVVPSGGGLRGKGTVADSVYILRKDGFDGDVKLSLKDPPEGFLASNVVLPAGKEMVRYSVRTSLTSTKQPVRLAIEGSATVGDEEIVRTAVPADDYMQAFLWRHFVPAEDIQVVVYDPNNSSTPKRVPPELTEEEKAALKPAATTKFTFSKRQVAGRLRQLKLLYEDWLLTDDFYNRKVLECEAVE